MNPLLHDIKNLQLVAPRPSLRPTSRCFFSHQYFIETCIRVSRERNEAIAELQFSKLLYKSVISWVNSNICKFLLRKSYSYAMELRKAFALELVPYLILEESVWKLTIKAAYQLQLRIRDSVQYIP